MIKYLKRLNEWLPSLIVGMLIFSGLVELICIWLVSDIFRFTTGLFIGTATAIWMAVNMASSLYATLQPDANNKMTAVKAVLRYIVVCAVIIATAVFRIGSPIAAFIGLMGLKVSAYLQPFIHRFILKDLKDDPVDEDAITAATASEDELQIFEK
jgi:hypothetical protein